MAKIREVYINELTEINGETYFIKKSYLITTDDCDDTVIYNGEEHFVRSDFEVMVSSEGTRLLWENLYCLVDYDENGNETIITANKELDELMDEWVMAYADRVL